MRETTPGSVALIGYGAMSRTVLAGLERAGQAHLLGAVVVLPGEEAAVQAAVPSGVRVVSQVAALAGLPVTLAVECAGHEAVRQHGPGALTAGMDLAVISVGALADDALLDTLRRAADGAGTQLLLPAGAVGGIDALAAARLAGLRRVTYTSHKPPHAWRGTPAEGLLALDDLREATVFYEGTARQAATDYPQNANVAATVALAGAGLDDTAVRLTADPAATGNTHTVEVEAETGTFTITLSGRTLPDNPKTSALAAYSVLRTVLQRGAAVVI